MVLWVLRKYHQSSSNNTNVGTIIVLQLQEFVRLNIILAGSNTFINLKNPGWDKYAWLEEVLLRFFEVSTNKDSVPLLPTTRVYLYLKLHIYLVFNDNVEGVIHNLACINA